LPNFAEYTLKSHWLQAQIETKSNSNTQMNIGMKDIPKLRFCLPPLSEQKKIASFLDLQTARIADLIAKRELQIELLQEHRTALISRAVMKGLNPDVPMKDSGVEWLGRISETWVVKKLKRIASLKSGDGIVSENISETGEFPVYGGNGLRGFTSRYTHDGFFVLIGRQGALCGNINYAEGKFWASEHAVVVSPITELAPRWLGELLRAMNLNQHSVSAAQPGLSVDMINNLYIPFPPSSEQEIISSFLTRKTAIIDTFVTKVQQSIEKLREYRQSLISAAVTGKIDVRNWQSSSEPTEETLHA
jgi:type I restriction enzyme S subunit